MSAGVFAEGLSKNPTVSHQEKARSETFTPGGLEPRNNTYTLGKMQLGSFTAKLVVAIEGCKYLLSDAPSASVLAAWAGHDATQVLGGLFVELQNSQSIKPDDPFPTGGRCIIRVLDQDHTDAFGIYVNKRASGDKTTITTTLDRNDTTITVASTQDFASSGDVYCGTEAIGYSGLAGGGTTLIGATRGKYSALGCDSTGSGGTRFARHHRVSSDISTTLSNPVVTEVPRYWIGKYVSVYLHTWDEATQQLNTRANAQLVYAGRIVGIADNASEMTTDLEVEHVAAEFKNGVIGADMLAADITPGITLIEGRTFRLSDWRATSAGSAPTINSATDLVVVASGASGAYQIDAGYYAGDELCAALSRWTAQAKTDVAINGTYTFGYAVSSNVGLRSKIYWYFGGAGVQCGWRMEMPGEIAAFLGFAGDAEAASGQQVVLEAKGPPSSEVDIYESTNVPYASLIFKPFGPGIFGLAFTYSLTYELENERGTFIDQTAHLPGAVKHQAYGESNVGIFMLDDKILMIAQYDAANFRLVNCRLAPFQLVAGNSEGALQYIGRRMDEPPAPVSIRQILILEGTFKDLVCRLVYSTGVTGYNHGTYDTLPSGFGLGIPGQLLGPEWDRSIANLPGADAPIALMLDEPMRFSELFRDDFSIRRAFIRWHDQGFEFGTWRTPLVGIAQHTLTEANKAAPVGTEDGHRVASEESDQWHISKTKINYSRDFGSSRSATYLRTIQLEDQAGTDGSGALGRLIELKMRNTFGQFQNTGTAIEELIAGYLVGMPMFSRPSRAVVRSIDLRQFETIGVGDIVLMTDSFARDPLTGQRGISSRAAIVVRKTYNLGGPTPSGSVRSMVGEVECYFLDTHRGGIYAPAAEIDYEKNYAGFSAGYNATTSQIWLKREAYSQTVTVFTKRGPVTYSIGHDADNIAAGDKLVIVEMDPTNTAAPTYWERTASTVSGDMATLTATLSAPAWDATKRYRVFYDSYTDCTATQKDYVFQADITDERIQDVEIADQYSSTSEPVVFTPTAVTDKAELVADLTWGDGKPLDVGTDATLAKTINAYIDYKSALQCPTLWNDPIATGAAGETLSTQVAPGYAGMIHLGTDITMGAITRTLTCALWLRSSDGNAAYARVRLSRNRPTGVPSAESELFSGLSFYDPQYTGEVDESATVTTSSTTWATTTDLTLSIGVKDLEWGCAWIIIELSGSAQCRGFAKLIEGPRE
jgi:hypothetical protein